jgi:hypothetical protein
MPSVNGVESKCNSSNSPCFEVTAFLPQISRSFNSGIVLNKDIFCSPRCFGLHCHDSKKTFM